VSGHVNEIVLYWDDGVESDVYQLTNVQSRTRFRFKGSAKITSDWSAGFLIEIGLVRGGSSLNYDELNDDPSLGTDSRLDIRHQALYVKSKRLGTFWMGHTSDATDGITQICLGCTMGNYHGVAAGDIVGNLEYRNSATGAKTGQRARTLISAEGARRSLVRWISPEFSGFVVSAHWGDEDTVDGEEWGVAVRYANEFNGVRVGAGVGYSVTATDDEDHNEFGLSASMAHVASGLYVAASYGWEDDEGLIGDHRDEMWHVGFGMSRKFSPLGKTSIGGYYGNFTWGLDSLAAAPNQEVDAFGLAINQKIDAAAMEVYLQYHNLSGESDAADYDDINLLLVGARIRF
ncbi:MAG: porin, partial [Hyphomicrobiaceae bacterium]